MDKKSTCSFGLRTVYEMHLFYGMHLWWEKAHSLQNDCSSCVCECSSRSVHDFMKHNESWTQRYELVVCTVSFSLLRVFPWGGVAYFSNIVGVVSFYVWLQWNPKCRCRHVMRCPDYQGVLFDLSQVRCLGPRDYRGDLISESPQLGVP